MKKILLYNNFSREHIVIHDKTINKEYIVDLCCYLKYLKYKIFRRYNLDNLENNDCFNLLIDELLKIFEILKIKKVDLVCSYIEFNKHTECSPINLIKKYNIDILAEEYLLKNKPFPKYFLKDFEPIFMPIYSIDNILNNIRYYEEKFKNINYREIEDYFIYRAKLTKKRYVRLNKLRLKLIEKIEDLSNIIFGYYDIENIENNRKRLEKNIKELEIIYNIYFNLYENIY